VPAALVEYLAGGWLSWLLSVWLLPPSRLWTACVWLVLTAPIEPSKRTFRFSSAGSLSRLMPIPALWEPLWASSVVVWRTATGGGQWKLFFVKLHKSGKFWSAVGGWFRAICRLSLLVALVLLLRLNFMPWLSVGRDLTNECMETIGFETAGGNATAEVAARLRKKLSKGAYAALTKSFEKALPTLVGFFFATVVATPLWALMTDVKGKKFFKERFNFSLNHMEEKVKKATGCVTFSMRTVDECSFEEALPGDETREEFRQYSDWCQNEGQKDVNHDEGRLGNPFILVPRRAHRQFTDQLINKMSSMSGVSYMTWDVAPDSVEQASYMFALTYEKERRRKNKHGQPNNLKFRMFIVKSEQFRRYFGAGRERFRDIQAGKARKLRVVDEDGKAVAPLRFEGCPWNFSNNGTPDASKAGWGCSMHDVVDDNENVLSKGCRCYGAERLEHLALLREELDADEKTRARLSEEEEKATKEAQAQEEPDGKDDDDELGRASSIDRISISIEKTTTYVGNELFRVGSAFFDEDGARWKRALYDEKAGRIKKMNLDEWDHKTRENGGPLNKKQTQSQEPGETALSAAAADSKQWKTFMDSDVMENWATSTLPLAGSFFMAVPSERAGFDAIPGQFQSGTIVRAK